MNELAAIVAGFALGAFPTAMLWGRARGLDLTRRGSGNPGAANAYRMLGVRAGLGVLAVDLAKGVLAVLSSRWLGTGELVQVAAGTASVAGHITGPFSGGRGGKGVATAFGMFLALAPAVAAFGAAIWIVVFAASRLVSLSSMLAIVSLPADIALLGPGAETPAFWGAVAVAVLVLFRHRANLARLTAGSEPRLPLRMKRGA